jgi:hypothetical protein
MMLSANFNTLGLGLEMELQTTVMVQENLTQVVLHQVLQILLTLLWDFAEVQKPIK